MTDTQTDMIRRLLYEDCYCCVVFFPEPFISHVKSSNGPNASSSDAVVRHDDPAAVRSAFQETGCNRVSGLQTLTSSLSASSSDARKPVTAASASRKKRSRAAFSHAQVIIDGPWMDYLAGHRLHTFYRLKLKLNLKPNKALDKNSSLSYGASPAMWDHTVLPATRHKYPSQ